MKRHVQNVFATISKNENDIYPPTVADIVPEQRESKQSKWDFCKKEFKKRKKGISLKVIDDKDILIYQKNRMVMPTVTM